MNNYWQKRYEKLKLSEIKKAEITAAKQKEIYQETLTRLRQQVLDWYDKYARENNISLADAQKQLTTSENKEFKITLEKYGELAKKENLSSEYKRLLENVSMKVRHARSQKLYVDTIHLVEQLAKTQKIQLEELLKDVYEDSVYKTAYEVQTMQGKYTQMQGLNEKEINEIIKKPWTEDGKEFSTRIWENKQKLVQTLTREMTRAFILKESTSLINERITKRFNVSYNEAKRLIETETAYIQEKAMLDTYDKLNVEKYEILAVLDSKTSEICRQMDGEIFEKKDAKAGITLPPFHCYCRSTTIPYIDDMEDKEETRASRDEDNKTEFIPKMSYEEWKEKYVVKGENKQTKALENGKNSITYLCNIPKEIYSVISKNICSDDVIITKKQIEHIKGRHPNDYEMYSKYFVQIIKEPDYILKDKRPNTALILGEIKDKSLNLKIVLRLITPEDSKGYKNSIITAQKINKNRYNQYLRNAEILYSKN